MDRRWVLLLVACMTGTAVCAQSVKKKPSAKMAKGSTKKKGITEAEAKRQHEAQLAKEGKTDFRRSYKRTDFEALPNGDNWAVDAPQQTQGRIVPLENPKPTPAHTGKTEPKPPRFIKTIVLERKEG